MSSSAATTTFCSARIDGPGGFHLFVDGNAKICRENGSFSKPKPNAFSLLEIDDCPDSTAICRAACYVHGLKAAQPTVHEMYRHNSETIRKIFTDTDALLAYDWAATFTAWIVSNCTSFRWHVSGDVFSGDYARWISIVCRGSLRVSHWLYTRSFEHVQDLRHAENLVVNLSVDAENYAMARETARMGGLRLCYLATVEYPGIPGTLPPDSVIFPDYALRPKDNDSWWKGLSPLQKKMVCPVDAWGKGEERRCGPCDRCLK